MDVGRTPEFPVRVPASRRQLDHLLCCMLARRPVILAMLEAHGNLQAPGVKQAAYRWGSGGRRRPRCCGRLLLQPRQHLAWTSACLRSVPSPALHAALFNAFLPASPHPGLQLPARAWRGVPAAHASAGGRRP